MNYSKTGSSLKIQILLYIPMLLFWGAILMVFLGLATLGTSYRLSIAQIIDAPVTEIVPLCQYEYPRDYPQKSKGVYYELPCSDTAAAKKLYDRGFILYRQSSRKLTLELQQTPPTFTTLIVSDAEVGALTVGNKLSVRVPVIRNSEAVELAAATPLSVRLATAFKYVALVYGLLWLIVLIFYRGMRQAFVDAYRESTKG